MARPTKEGLDYFPLDCRMDDKFDFIEAKHGITGWAVLIKLFQKIYFQGYHLEWSERASVLFASKNNIDIETLDSIIQDAINDKIFDKSVYRKFSILTSHGIQKRYVEATKRRKEIKCIKQIALVDFNVHDNSVNVNINSQSKVKESKVKESKELLSFDFEYLWKKYLNKTGKTKAKDKFEKSVKTEDDYSNINIALDKYLAHLKIETWKKPQNGSTWFGNWKDWVDWIEPEKPSESSGRTYEKLN